MLLRIRGAIAAGVKAYRDYGKPVVDDPKRSNLAAIQNKKPARPRADKSRLSPAPHDVITIQTDYPDSGRVVSVPSTRILRQYVPINRATEIGKTTNPYIFGLVVGRELIPFQTFASVDMEEIKAGVYKAKHNLAGFRFEVVVNTNSNEASVIGEGFDELVIASVVLDR